MDIFKYAVDVDCSRDTLYVKNVEGQRSRSQRDVTYQQYKSYKSRTDLTEYKVGENYPSAERNMWCMFKFIRLNASK